MAKTFEQLIQEALGAQQLQILKLVAQLEQQKEEIAALKPTPPTP
jgi:hypothetical protein